MNTKASEYIEALNMQKHIEGGYFVETFKSQYSVSSEDLPDGFTGKRSLMTSIYFLLEGNDISKLHRVRGDEIWFFHDGSPAIIEIINPNGKVDKMILGTDVKSGQLPQIVIPADTWFTAKIADEDSFVLIACTVAPGFEYVDFELADPEKLILEFPHLKEIILKST
ncbi:MAG: cupin domain-containing protein [Candidatus Kapabacteria bacterium]|nr:cupin domain-containing protein [Candidatus Kapabacteria bacterium]